MLKQPLLPLRCCAAVAVLVAVLGFGGAYVTCAAQSSRSQPIAAATGTQVDAQLKISVDGGPDQSVHLINPVGEPFAIHSNNAKPAWDAQFTARRVEDGNIELSSTIRIDGKMVGEPVIVAKPDQPTSIEVGEPGKPRFRLEATLALHHAGWQPPATSAGTTPAGYDRLTPPRYPASAVKQNIEGLVVVAAQIDAKGKVTSAIVDHLEPPTAQMLGDVATGAVKRWRFKPALRNGMPVAGQALVPVRFSIGKNGSVQPPQSVLSLPPGALELIDVVGTRMSR